jgi:regulator of replication initiation timing
MTGTEQLQSDPDADGEEEGSLPLDRRLWEAREEIAELRARLAEQLERERILELEIAAVRKDLEVKVAYSEALDKAAEERQNHTYWLQSHFDAERKRADDATAELEAERSRIYYRLAQPVVRALRGRSRP